LNAEMKDISQYDQHIDAILYRSKRTVDYGETEEEEEGYRSLHKNTFEDLKFYFDDKILNVC